MSELKIHMPPNQDIDWLITAAEDVSHAAESDFEAMKTKSWYKRLWETVTFSKNNQVRLANGVTNLAKLQDLIVRALLIVSKDNVAISEQIKENSDRIQRLSCANLLLLQEINKMKYGERNALAFSALERDKKAIIVALVSMADSDVAATEASKQYMASLLRLANVSVIDNVAMENIEKLNASEQELLYQMIMIRRYLAGINFHAESAVLDELDIKNRRKREICETISKTAENVTPDFFATFYEDDTYCCDIVDDFGFEFIDTEEHEIEEDDYDFAEDVIPDISDFEEITISNILHIGSGETCVYRHKIIHFQVPINCEGTLIFDTCILHYGEDGVHTITLSGNASLSMYRCTIKCHDSNEKSYFISAKNMAATPLFEKCKFINTANFIEGKTVKFSQNIFMNARANTITAEMEVDLSFCRFEYDCIETSHWRREGTRVIRCNSGSLTQCTVIGLLHIASLQEYEAVKKDFCYWPFIDANEIRIKNSSFVGVRDIVNSYKVYVEHSLFEHCFDVLLHYCLAEFNECRFEYCSQIAIGLSEKSTIVNCQFNNCFCKIFSTSDDGGMSIKFCEFNNWEGSPLDGLAASNNEYVDAMLEFGRSNDKKRANLVESCVFDGINAHQWFLIKGNAKKKLATSEGRFSFDNEVANVQKCTFRNCVTNRSSGKIIKEYGVYQTGLIKKTEKSQLLIKIHTDCTGLDKINKAGNTATNAIKKTKSNAGIVIGAEMGTIFAGIPEAD